MQINPYSPVYGSSPTNPVSRPAAPRSSDVVTDRVQLSAARRHLFRVLEAFDELQRLTTGGSTILSGLPSARSSSPLGLDLTSTFSSLQSVEEVNATPTSFTPFVPNWDGGSDAFLTFGGAYDGSNGTGALSFEVRRGGVHGEDRLRVRVRDADNNIINNITIRESHALDHEYNLGNGLFFTLGAGSLERRDTTSIQVYDNVGSVVDPDQAFNATGNDNPNYQYGMPQIVAGSFTVNGITINVNDSDSLNDVLNTINESEAGVTAVFNPVTERIDFEHNTAGSAGEIEIVAGDSNFVEATKLLDAIAVPGVDPETLRPLDTVAQFTGVTSGEVVINGESIAIDAGNDSLTDIIARINSSDAGANASFDEDTQRVVITGQDSGDVLIIDGNGTGLFGALNMPEGRVDPTAQGNGYGRRRAHGIVRAMDEAMSALNDFFQETRSEALVNKEVAALRNQLKGAVSAVLDSGDVRVDTGFGLTLNLDAVGKQYSKFAALDEGRFSQRLQTRSARIDQFLNGTSDNIGLIDSVGKAAQQAFLSLNDTLGTRGTLFDAFA
ncbi:MAG: hypothetical protein HKN70_01000 [Gammaproteobacteria bacterium]|nr:hypothetical protein [Gammaproteobacteria bacterium]